jgi:hypothetical protein
MTHLEQSIHDAMKDEGRREDYRLFITGFRFSNGSLPHGT